MKFHQINLSAYHFQTFLPTVFVDKRQSERNLAGREPVNRQDQAAARLRRGDPERCAHLLPPTPAELPHTLDGEPAPGQHKHSRERQPAESDRARSKRRVSAIRA